MDNNVYTEPKSVKENGSKFECPTCNIEINKQTSPQQCKYCGQQLDWRPKGTVFFRGQMLRVGEDVFFGREPAWPSDRFAVDCTGAIEAFNGGCWELIEGIVNANRVSIEAGALDG